MASRVVPATESTTMRSSPMMALRREDLPTLGRPTMAVRTTSSSSSAGSVSGRMLGDRVEQLLRGQAVGGGDGDHLPYREAVEVGDPVLAATAVHLVHRDHDGLAGAAEHLGDVLVEAGDALFRVHHEDDDVGLFDSELHLLDDLDLEGVSVGLQAAGVDQHEPLAIPFAVRIDAVAGDAGGRLLDGEALPGEAIEEGGLAHVGPPHDRHHAPVGWSCFTHGASSILRPRASAAAASRGW